MKLAVIIATYRRPDGSTPFYLNRALESINKQTHRDYKVYVVGDDYTDRKELESVVSKYPQVVVHNLDHSPERSRYGMGNMKLWCAGGVTACNTGISMALSEGYEYICHQGHDDWWEPNHLELINKIIEEKSPLFCCTLSTYFGTHIMPGFPVTNEILPYLPIDGGMIAASACVKYSDTKIRVMDRLHEEGIMSPSDAYLWEQLRKEMQATNKEGFVYTTITCHHDEEGSAMRMR